MTNPWLLRDLSAKLETGGAWLNSRQVPGWRFRLRRMSDWNTDYHRAVVRLVSNPAIAAYIKKMKESPDAVPGDEERKLDAIMDTGAFVEGCLVTWDGVTDRDGRTMACTPENAVNLFAHFRNLFVECRTFAQDARNFTADFGTGNEVVRKNF